MEFIFSHEILVLLAVIFSGCALGLLRIKGVGLGSTACLFTGLAAGAMGASIPSVIEQIGILFFVYSIGLSMGPRFFHLFRGKAGLNVIVLALTTIAIGVFVSALGAAFLNLPDGAFIGVFAGALTSTPTLASALDAAAASTGLSAGKISVAYTVTYPLGFLLIVLFVQYTPRIFKKKFNKELELEKKRVEEDDFQTRAFVIGNEKFIGKRLGDLNFHRFCHVNITRIKRGADVALAGPDSRFKEGDIVVAVGLPVELEKFEKIFGERYEGEIELSCDMNIKDIVLASTKFAGKKLKDLKIPTLYGVSITRIRRSGMNIAPHGNTMLEMGDEIRIFGNEASIIGFVKIAGLERKKLDVTNLVILSLGMFAGLVLGYVPFEAGGLTFRLGAAGGPLLVALFLGHFGKIGRWSVRLPIATRIFLREFGLVFFLSSVGVSSGARLAGAVFGLDVLLMVFLGAIVALVTMFGSYFVAVKILSMPISSSLGAMCGAMTSTPALGVLIKEIDDESPTIAYASIYPIATILLTISGQILVWISYIPKIFW